MMSPWALSVLWVGLALIATPLAIWFEFSTTLSEIGAGSLAQLIIGVVLGTRCPRGNTQSLARLLTEASSFFSAARMHRYDGFAGAYCTLMMSNVLASGAISAHFGLNHQIIAQTRYPFLLGTVIASGVIPTVVADAFFLPRHLTPHAKEAEGSRPLERLYRKWHRWAGWEAQSLLDFRGSWLPLMDHLMRGTL